MKKKAVPQEPAELPRSVMPKSVTRNANRPRRKSFEPRDRHSDQMSAIAMAQDAERKRLDDELMERMK